MWVNKYKESGWFKSLIKETYYFLRFAYLFVANGFKVKSVLFYPEFPLFKTEINSILRMAGYNITNNPELDCVAVVAWQDITFRPDYPVLNAFAANTGVVNGNCNDISKRRVEDIQKQVFGYSLGIDPLLHDGPCVRKSNLNGRHNETEIVVCPIEQRVPESIYQRLVNNRVQAGVVEDIRVHVIGSAIPYVVIRKKPENARFYGDFKEEVREVKDHLSADEVARLLEFSRIIGLDYGEMDTVRERDDGRLYVVDVNNTPYSAPASAGLTREDRLNARQRSCVAFANAFLLNTEALVPTSEENEQN